MTYYHEKRRILVTRPEPLGEALCDAIRAAGDDAISFPTIEIAPPHDLSLLEKNIESLADFDWVIFISPQAVLRTAHLIKKIWPTFPSHLHIAAIGAGTANTLKENDFPNALFPDQNENSEGLLALPEFQIISQKKIAIIRGEGGRELLEKELNARGAQVTSFIAYRRALPLSTPSIKIENIDIIISTSNESLRNLTLLIKSDIIFSLPLIVISQRMLQEAKSLGFKKIFVAKDASHHAILETLKDMKGQSMTNNTEQKPKTHSSKFAYFFIVLLILVIIAAGCFSYFQMTHRMLKSTEPKWAQPIADLQKTVDGLQQQLQQANSDIQNQAQTISTLQQIQGNNKDVWLMLETQYLVKLANDTLQYENDPAKALALLQAADKNLQPLSDSKTTNIRQALATDIAALQAVQQVDTVGLYAKLSAQNQQVDSLPLPTKISAPTETTSTDNSHLPLWKRGLLETWHALGKIVVVRYSPAGSLPLLTPEQQDFLYENVHASLEKAMWGLLHQQPEIYKSSLQQTIDWVKKYFVQDSPITQSMLKNLNDLLQVDVHPTMPDISASVDAFKGA